MLATKSKMIIEQLSSFTHIVKPLAPLFKSDSDARLWGPGATWELDLNIHDKVKDDH